MSGSSEQSNTVADTAYVSRAPDQYRHTHTSTSALSANCNLISITPKSADELPDPLHSRALVVKAVVCFVSCLAQFFGGRKSRETQSIAVSISRSPIFLRFQDLLDGDTDDGLLSLDRHLHNGSWIIVRVPTTSNSKAASVYENKDG